VLDRNISSRDGYTLPRKVDHLALTQKVVKTLIAEGAISDRKLARLVGTTSAKKVRQIAEIAGTAAYLLASDALSRVRPHHKREFEAVKQGFKIPRVIEIRNAPDIITIDAFPVYEARLNISKEVSEAVSESGVISPELKGKPLNVTLTKKFNERTRTEAHSSSPKQAGK